MIKNQASLFVFNKYNHLEVVITEYNKDINQLSSKDIYQFEVADPLEGAEDEEEETYDDEIDNLLERLEEE